MTRKELVEKFHLTKTDTKGYFYDGRTEQCRTLYINEHGKLFVFYGNDLHTFTPYIPYLFYENDEKEIDGKIGSGYSWYH